MRYLIVALVVSLAWLHQDWLIWPLLSEVQKEHDLILGIPAGLGYQVALSFAAAAVWFMAVWKAWPTELENWASAGGHRRGGGNRNRGRGQGGRDNRGRTQRGDYRPSGERSERSGNDGNEGRSRSRRGGRGRRSGGQGNGGNPNSSNNPS
ncbi:hypothetical protein OAK45_08105 [Verrucomicrobia bacterium]|nr:hypothetical protein [Verrucomicrobiota bacterium]